MPRAPRRVITMAGVPIALDASDEPRWQAVDALFGTCPDGCGPSTVSLTFGALAPPAPTGPPDVRFSDVELWCTESGVVTRQSSGLVIRRDGGRIVAGGPDSGADLPRAFRRSVQHVLVDALADHGRFALHAAALARDGGAVVVLGDTGAGKSTLAVSAGGAGWAVLTDDIAWLAAGEGGLTVTGFPKPLHVPPDLRAEVPAATGRVIGDERGRFVARTGLTADDVAHPLRGVVEVRHGDGAGELRPLASGPHLLAMAMRSYPLQADPGRVRRFFPVAVQLCRLPAVTLCHAVDPAVRSRRAAALLDEAWRGLVATPVEPGDAAPDQ